MTRWAALQYARWLSLSTGRLYRLPTEAEWEYACRAGGTGAGPDPGNPAALERHAWLEANSDGSYHPVGETPPNGFGLHDLRGNVAEWILEDHRPEPYAVTPDANRAGPEIRVRPRSRGLVRGGSFRDPPEALRCDARQPESAAWKRRDPQIPRSAWWNTDSPHVGFRLVSPVGELELDEIREYWRTVLGD